MSRQTDDFRRSSDTAAEFGTPAPEKRHRTEPAAASTEQLELIPVPRCTYCGPLQHTIDRWGRETHKCSCPHRTDDFCQAHPTVDCELPKPKWNPKWPLTSLYGTTWEDAFGCSGDAVDESAGLKETA